MAQYLSPPPKKLVCNAHIYKKNLLLNMTGFSLAKNINENTNCENNIIIACNLSQKSGVFLFFKFALNLMPKILLKGVFKSEKLQKSQKRGKVLHDKIYLQIVNLLVGIY